ncbi:uncharacterized protein LOC123684782 [Harmonia axyridis]|uniref:uncharacterized protein LOC123684782 n=1 Tax=Harmonia axyridis TaxID=115357 RepID=UPI001E27545E|nr:uncharacterized protein LOC123684782 [Harmonia axyridis]
MKFTLVLVFVIGTTLVQKMEAKKPKRVECLQCDSTSQDSACKRGDASDTCLGKYCYQYVYQEHTKNFLGTTYLKWWWFRGCTDDENTCSGEYVSDCTVCSESKCNDVELSDV